MTDEELNRIIYKRFIKQDKRINDIVNTYSERLRKNYQDALKQINRELNYVKFRYKGNTDIVQYQALINKRDRVKTIISNLDKQTTSVLAEGLKYAYKDNYYRTGFILESSTGINLSFSLIDENVVRHALLNPLNKIRWNTRLKGWNANLKKEVNDSIRAEIAKGITSGQGIDKIASRIVTSVSNRVEVAFSRAQNIARTEVHRVTSIARQDAFNVTEKAASNLGMKVQRRWLATLDNRTREDHQAMDGEYADSNGYWVESLGKYIPGPGQSGVAEFDIGCRCTEITEIEGFETKSRLDNISKESIEFTNYQDWYASRKAS